MKNHVDPLLVAVKDSNTITACEESMEPKSKAK